MRDALRFLRQTFLKSKKEQHRTIFLSTVDWPTGILLLLLFHTFQHFLIILLSVILKICLLFVL